MERNKVLEAVDSFCRRNSIDRFIPKGALIDMDGTLIDSMVNHTAAWKRLVDELGIPADRNDFYLYEGMTGRATIRLIFRRAMRPEPTVEECDELYSRKARYFNELPKVPVIAGADEMLKLFMKKGIKRVLVTGSRQLSNLDRLDSAFPGAFPHDLRITAADVVNGKPHPEPYLKGMALVNLSPAESLVVENAPLGVEAGRASGAFTIAVATGPIPVETLYKAGADLAFGSMTELVDTLPFLI